MYHHNMRDCGRMKKIQYNGISKLLSGITTKINSLIDIVELKADWEQTDPTAFDYIKNKPDSLDEKVKQENTTSDEDYRVLLSKSANDITEIDKTWKNSDLKYNPFTGNLTAVRLNGNEIGNDPQFTDTTYTASGVVSIDANNNITSTAEENQNTFAKVKVGSTTITADAKQDTLELYAGNNITLTPDANNDKVTIAATDTTYTAGTRIAISSSNVISTTAEINQNTFSNVKVGDVTIEADSKTDTLELIQGSNVTLTPNATNDSITIAATDTNTHRPIQLNGTQILGNNTTALNLKNGDNISMTNSSGTVTINATGIPSKQSDLTEVRLTNEDLNDVTYPGFYYAAGGNTVTNKPTGYNNFGLVVVHNASGSQYTQVISNENGSYRRIKNADGTWTSWAEDKFTDENVKQNASITTNADYRVLLSGSANDNADTNFVNKSTNLKYNPSTTTLTAPKIVASSTQDAAGTSDNKPALMVGNISGTHLELDGNELMAKASGTTTTTLHINTDGGKVVINNNTQGIELSDGTIMLKASNGKTTKILPSEANANRNYYLPNGKADNSELAVTSDIPTALADLTDDATHRVVTDTQISSWDAKAGSDVNVTQTLVTTNKNYPLLFSTRETSDTTVTRTGTAQRNNSIYVNPSTGNLQTTKINGVAVGSSPKFTDTIYTVDTSTGLVMASEQISIDKVPIENGGTNATTRLAALKNLTNQSVTTPNYVFGMTTSWATGGYVSIANLKTTIGLNKDVPANAIFTDENVKQTQIEASDTGWYKLLLSNTSSGTLTGGANKTEGVSYKRSTPMLSIDSADGVAGTAKLNYLKIGNETASSDAGNTQGDIRLCSSNSGYIDMRLASTTQKRVVTFPDPGSGNKTVMYQSNMSTSELVTGTATTTRTVRADYLNAAIKQLIDDQIYNHEASKSCIVGSDASANLYFHVCTIKLEGLTEKTDVSVMFSVNNTFSSNTATKEGAGILYMHVRADTTHSNESMALKFVSNVNFNNDDFKLGYGNYTSAGVSGIQYELWTKIDTRWMFRRFTILSQGYRKHEYDNITTLDSDTTGSSTLPTRMHDWISAS